jgi:hypothetical protein
MSLAGALPIKLMEQYLTLAYRPQMFSDAHIRVAWSQLVDEGWVKETSAGQLQA